MEKNNINYGSEFRRKQSGEDFNIESPIQKNTEETDSYYTKLNDTTRHYEPILLSFKQSMDARRSSQGAAIIRGAFNNLMPNNKANLLAFVSTVKYNEVVSAFLDIGDRLDLRFSWNIDNITGDTIRSTCKKSEDESIGWLVQHDENKRMYSELGKILQSNDPVEMSRKVDFTDLSVFPSELPNILVSSSDSINVEMIHRYINFYKKSKIHRKNWDDSVIKFEKRVETIGECEQTIDRLELVMAKLRLDQDIALSNGRKINVLAKNKKNILKFISTIQYNDAVWAMQTLGIDSGMRPAPGLNKTDVEKNVLKNEYIAKNSLLWLAPYHTDRKMLEEMDRLFELVSHVDVRRLIDEHDYDLERGIDINLSVFPDEIPNILVMRPIRFVLKK